jgi:hypothetical protein
VNAATAECYVPHRPVGERCGHAQLVHDGRPDNDWNFDVREAWAEIDGLHKNDLDPRLTDAEHAEYANQLKILMLKARTGTVALGASNEGTVIRDRLVELKPKLEARRQVFGRQPRLLRLYLGEPAVHPKMLLALRLSTKEDSEAGLHEQDEDIDLALERVERWCLGGQIADSVGSA